MTTDTINFLRNMGYSHIGDVITQTEERLQRIRNGELYPIITSSKKEEIIMGGYYPGDQVVIAGRTGCTVAGTKIRIRKKSNKIRSKIVLLK